MEYKIGDIVRTKKVHPCGSKLWEITRVGVDFKLKCQGCEHVIVLPREKALKIITKKVDSEWINFFLKTIEIKKSLVYNT